MLDRFRLLVLASYKRSGVTLAQRVMSSNLVNEEDQHRNFRQKKVDEHILMGYAINMCNVGAIQKPCTDLFTYMMLAGETPLLEYLGWRDMGARATQRGMLDVSIFAFDKVRQKYAM